MKTVLLLGAGRISAPYVDYLLRKGSCKIVVADVSEENLKAISALSPAVETVKADVAREAGALIDKYRPEVAALFLPPELLTGASRTCLEKRVNVVHPVYLTEETRAMADEIREAGLIFVAELGLDPGIDHMSASQNINEIHAAGGNRTLTRGGTSFRGRPPALLGPASGRRKFYRMEKRYFGRTERHTSMPSCTRSRGSASSRPTPTPIRPSIGKATIFPRLNRYIAARCVSRAGAKLSVT